MSPQKLAAFFKRSKSSILDKSVIRRLIYLSNTYLRFLTVLLRGPILDMLNSSNCQLICFCSILLLFIACISKHATIDAPNAAKKTTTR